MVQFVVQCRARESSPVQSLGAPRRAALLPVAGSSDSRRRAFAVVHLAVDTRGSLRQLSGTSIPPVASAAGCGAADEAASAFCTTSSHAWLNELPPNPPAPPATVVPSGATPPAAPAPRRPRTVVYVDGFNLYYGALKGTTYKWLDLAAFCRRLLPRNDVSDIHYFTARVIARARDPHTATRQQTYLRALATLPHTEVHFGHYLEHVVSLPLASPGGGVVMRAGKIQFARVLKAEEKGSDVNLATRLVHDAHLSRFEAAAVVSNDSDLAGPIALVTRELGLPVGVINPHASNPRSRHSVQLQQVASFRIAVRPSVLMACQFPDTVTDAAGQFRKLATW